MKSSYLNRRDLGKAGQVFRIGDGWDELDWSDDGTRWAAESVSAGHAGAGGTGGVGVVQGGHREGACVTRVGVLHGDKRRPGVSEVRKKDGGKREDWPGREDDARESMAGRGEKGMRMRRRRRRRRADKSDNEWMLPLMEIMARLHDACGCGDNACCTNTQMAE